MTRSYKTKIISTRATQQGAQVAAVSVLTNVSKYEESHIVQLVADDLGIAPVVVPAGHSELKRPEQSVVHLNKDQEHN